MGISFSYTVIILPIQKRGNEEKREEGREGGSKGEREGEEGMEVKMAAGTGEFI